MANHKWVRIKLNEALRRLISNVSYFLDLCSMKFRLLKPKSMYKKLNFRDKNWERRKVRGKEEVSRWSRFPLNSLIPFSSPAKKIRYLQTSELTILSALTPEPVNQWSVIVNYAENGNRVAPNSSGERIRTLNFRSY